MTTEEDGTSFPCTEAPSFFDSSHGMTDSAHIARTAAATVYSTCGSGGIGPCLSAVGPLPICVAVIDSSIELFGRLFPLITHRHRLQMIEHFAECIRLNKSSRQEAVQLNTFAALLNAMKRLVETKSSFGPTAEMGQPTARLFFVSPPSQSSILLACVYL